MAQETILVIDDGKDNRDFIVEYVLKPNGYNSLTAKDGQEGFQMAMQHKPDLILLDLQMPRMTGIDVLQALQDKKKEIPVILMTFHGSEEIAVEVYRMGVKDYVKKPYYPEEMLESIDKALLETRLKRERDSLTNRIIQANQRLQRQLREMQVLFDIGKLVTSTTHLDELLPDVVDAAVSLTNAEAGNITLIEEKQFVRRAVKNIRAKQAESMKQPVKDRIVDHAVNNQRPVMLGPDTLRRNGNNKAPLSVACVPITINQQTIGALEVINHSDSSGVFTESHIQLLSAVCDYAAIAIENSRNYSALHSSKERMRDTFEKFVPPSVVQQALSDEVKPGGERQEVSVLFADIRGYTAFSENANPETVVEMLNHYLSVAGNIIIAWEGTLDKFMGDGLMALFNAPNAQPDHVHRAAESAIAIQRAVNDINEHYGYKLDYSVGVHVGEAVVGYIGTSYAVNYTAIGDTVNLAKRLQEAAAPGQILVDENVIKRLGNLVQAKPIGDIKIKGRKKPSYAYELIELKEPQ